MGGNKVALIGIILIVGVFGFIVFSNSGSSSEGDVIKNPIGNGEVQEVVIGMKNYNYYPQVVKVKVNQPVRIYLDDRVYGCFRAFTIRELGIAKNLRTPQDYVEFTPTKKGTYQFACSMNMGTGTLIVE